MIIVIRKVVQRARSRFRDRALEWEHSIMATLFGGIIIANPDVVQGPSFTAFPITWLWLWGPVILTVGVACLIALSVNGFMAKPTALVRAAAAAMRVIVFGLLSLGFLFSWSWPTALAVYPVIAFFGLFPLFWTILDVAYPDRNEH